MTQHPDVLICGAGPVGLTAALELTRRGFRPAIIDDDDGPSPESRALAIHPRTLDILEPSGVTERLLAAGNVIRGLILCLGAERRGTINLSRMPHRFNFILTLPQAQTEGILHQVLGEQGGQVAWRTKLKGLESRSGSYLYSVATPQGESVMEADMVVGADGAHSAVRDSLGLTFVGETEPDTFQLADVVLDDWPFAHDHGVLFLGDTLCAYFPYREGEGRFVANHPDLFNRLPFQPKVKKVKWQSEFRISYRLVESYQRGNIFLAGDAAHIHSPVGGRGMNLGIEDAATLAWLIATRAAGRYTAMRHPIARSVLRMTGVQTSLLTSKSAALRSIVSRIVPLLTGLPVIGSKVLEQFSGLNVPFPPWLEKD